MSIATAETIDTQKGRWYRTDSGLIVPSVTSICNVYPKEELLRWYGQAESYEAANALRDEAADRGTLVHDAAQRLVHGDTVNLEGWEPKAVKLLQGFVNFWHDMKPTLIASEVVLVSEVYAYAGTCDLVLVVGEDLWLLDIKTSGGIYPNHHLQTAAYAVAYTEQTGARLDLRGCLWLKTSTKKGYQLVTSPQPDSTDFEGGLLSSDFRAFLACKEVFHHLNGLTPQLPEPVEIITEIAL